MNSTTRAITLLRGLSRVLNQGTELLLLCLGLCMVLVIGLQVFFRYVLNDSLGWSEELGRALLVWLTFFGAGAACKRKGHIGVDFFVRRLAPAPRRVTAALALLVSICFFLIMIVYGLEFSWFIRHQATTILELPKWLLFLAVPASGLLMFFHSLVFLIDLFKPEPEK